MGCVFMEILIWTFGLSDSDFRMFESDRLGPQVLGHQTTAYWYRLMH